MTDDRLSGILYIIGGALYIIGGALWIGGCWWSESLAKERCADQAIKPDFEQPPWWRKLLLDARCRAEKKNLK